jgi:hypothetical protein
MQHFAIWEKAKIRRIYRENALEWQKWSLGMKKPERFGDRSG